MPWDIGKGPVKGTEASIKREGYPRKKVEVLALAKKKEICFSDLCVDRRAYSRDTLSGRGRPMLSYSSISNQFCVMRVQTLWMGMKV